MSKLLSLNGQPTKQSVRVPAGTLYSHHIEIESGKQTIWNLLLKKQIKAFYDQNGLVLREILDKAGSIQKKYLVMEGDKIKMENKKPVLIEGKTEEDLNKEWDELMTSEINMIV